MRVEAIKQVGADFAQAINDGSYTLDYDIAYVSIENWKQHFSFHKEEPQEVYDRSLHNPDTARLWGGSTNSIKSSLLSLMAYDTDTAMMALFDLFNEGKDLTLRLGRYEEYMMDIYQRLSQNNKRVEAFRQDRSAAFLHLMHAYPQDYCLFLYEDFHRMMEDCGSINIPTKYETGRYAKICKTLYTLLLKEDRLVDAYTGANRFSDEIHLVMLNDVMRFCGSRAR